MTDEFSMRRLKGARFHQVDLRQATFDHVTFADATFTEIDFTGVKIRGALFRDVDVSADVEGLRINTVDVGPLIEAELDRRHPERAKLRPPDAAGFREAWSVIEGLWDETVARARGLDPALLHERANGEWSFVETLRHLVFATDSWVGRALLGEPAPWHPLALPWDEMPDIEGVPRDRDARPSLDEVLAIRVERMATVRRFLDGLTDDALAGSTEPVTGAGWPRPGDTFAVREVLGIVLNEEWWHRQFAERDLAILSGGGEPVVTPAP